MDSNTVANLTYFLISLAVQHERAPRNSNNNHASVPNNNNINGSITPHHQNNNNNIPTTMPQQQEQQRQLSNTMNYEQSFPQPASQRPTTNQQFNQFGQFSGLMVPPNNFSPPYTPDEDDPDRKTGFMNIATLLQGNNGMVDQLHDITDAANFNMADKLPGLQNIPNENIIPTMDDFPTQNLINPEKIYESSVRILYTSVSWARSIPTFLELPFPDQALLLEECWSELFILCMIQCSVPMDLSVLLSAAGAHAEKELAQNVPNSVQDLKTLQRIVQRFQNLGIDSTEFACLKATVLFKPGKRIERLDFIYDMSGT